jgi:hypothetical protein
MKHRGIMFAPRTLIALVISIAAVGALPAAAAAATHPITFSVTMGQQCINGTATDGSTVQLLWKSAAGSRKAFANVVASPTGHWSFCSPNMGTIVRTGDRITANDGTSTHQLVVPELTLFSNRDTDVFKGRGPAGQIIKLVCNFANGFEPCDDVWRIRVNSQGQWSLRPGWEISGEQAMFVYWRSTAGDKVQADHLSTFVTVTIGLAGISGSTRSGSTAAIYLVNPTTEAIRGTAFGVGSPYDGQFTGRFSNEQGSRVRVRVGDRIVSDAAADMDWIVGDIEATANVETQEVTGRCFEPGGLFRVYVYRNGQFVDGEYWWTDDEGPTFTMEYVTFQSGDDLLVWCPVGTGDWVRKWFAVP